MSHLTTLMRHLEAYVQEEIGAQARLLALLEAQEQAVRASEHEAITAANRKLDDELRSSAARARRRGLLLEGFGRVWELDPSTLTLSSLCERIGGGAERLQRQRTELRAVTAKVARRARRVGAAARSHQRLTAEIIETVLTGAENESLRSGGVLVDAEA